MQNNIYDSFFSFFGLRENPFTVNPDPRFLFMTPQIQEALAEISHGLQIRKGIILFTGEVGTGKTTVIYHLLDWLHQRHTPTAFIFNSQLETRDLFDFMLSDFGVSPDPSSSVSPLMRLNQWLFERYRAGETPVLIVDEAQGLPIHVLEEIRLLLNLETRQEKLLQILLVGQPELDEKLRRHELRQLNQRITLRCKTGALTREETHDYIKTRLQIAGSNDKQVFALQAIDAIHFYSRGIPRVMNLLCEHALINAYADDLQLVPAQMVEVAAYEFQFAERSFAPSLKLESDANSGWMAEQTVIPESPAPISLEVAPRLLEKPDTVVTLASVPLMDPSPSAKLPDRDRFSLRDSKVPVFHSHAASITSAPKRQLIEFGGSNENANKLSDTNVSSGRRLIAEPAAKKLPITRSSVIRSAEVRKDSNLGEPSHHFWAHCFDKRDFRQRVVEGMSGLVCSARRIFVVILMHLRRWPQKPLVQKLRSSVRVHNSPLLAFGGAITFLRATFGSHGSMWRDAGQAWQRTTMYLLRWLQQPLVQKQRSNAPVHNPAPTVVQLAITFLRQESRSWCRLLNSFLFVVPRPSCLSLMAPLLQWLRQPVRPFHLRHSGPR